MKKILIIFAFVLVLCVSAFAADTVYVSSNGDDAAAGTKEAPFATLYTAFRALPYGGKIVVMNSLSLDLTEFPASKGLVTVTSYDGTTDYSAKAMLVLNKNVYIKSAVKFEKIRFKVNDTNISIIASGNYTCFGEGISMIKAFADYDYPHVVAGASGLVGSDGGHLEIYSGTYGRIYGGATGTNSAAQSGNMTVAIYGGEFNNVFYLTGVTEFTGNANICIYGGTFNNGFAGAAISNISGNIDLTIYGGSFGDDSYVRPATNGTLSGKCTVNILGGNVKKIYNTDTNGSVTGDLKINLTDSISLSHNPFKSVTAVVTSDDVTAITGANDTALAASSAAKLPADTANPLTSRETKYSGIATKATTFKKETAGGDFDGDGIVTLLDTLRAFKAACGNYNELADINEDKEISVFECMLILSAALNNDGAPITEYTVTNSISRLIRYGNAVVSENTFNCGYVFGTTTDAAYTVSSKVEFEDGGLVGIFFGCNSTNPAAISSGYYFEADTENEVLTVYRIENSIYRVIAEKKLHLLSNEAQIKAVYSKTQENAVQLYFNDNPLINDYYFDFDLILESKGTAVGMYVQNATATTPVVTPEVTAAATSTYTNYILGGITDPEIYYENGIYYIYGTKSSGTSEGVECFTTRDFVTFEEKGVVLAKTDGYGDKNIVAANVIKSGDIYYMFYLQESEALGVNTTSFATATSPKGPFVTEDKVPLVENTDIIGGQPFVDEDGTVYLVYTRTKGGNKTYVAKVVLEDGNAELDLTTESQLLIPTEEWEYAKASVVECGFIIKHEGTYYLIYAGGNYNSTYGVGYATSDNIYGPYTKYSHNPILWSNDQAFGNGAASVFVSPDASEHFIIYLRNNGHTVTRPLNTCIDRIRFVTNPYGGPDILEIEGASVSPRPLPSGIGSSVAFDYQSARWHW